MVLTTQKQNLLFHSHFHRIVQETYRISTMLFSPDCYDSLTLNYQGHFMDYDPLNTWCLMPRLFNSFLIGLYTYFRAFNLDVQTNHTLCLYYHCSKNKQYICTLFCQSQVSLKYIHWRICRYTSTLIRRFFFYPTHCFGYLCGVQVILHQDWKH